MSRRRRFVSMRLIVTVVAVSVTAAAVLLVGILSERHTRRTLTDEIQTRLRLQARNLAQSSSGALLSDYPELTLHPLVKEMQAELSELAFVVVLDLQGIIQGHADARSLGQSLDIDPALRVLEFDPGPEDGERLFGDERVLVAAAPVQHPDGRRIGSAVVGLYRDSIAAKVQAVRVQQLVLVGAMLLVASVLAMVLMSRLLRPIGALRAGLERIGRGDLDTPIRLRGRTELGLLAEAVNKMSAELKNAQAEMVEKERLAHELELGREIQRGLLPAAGMSVGEFRVEGAQRAAAEVGGDYYDYFELPGGRVGLAIADVAGKGLAGCLIMSMLSALLRSHCRAYDSPTELLSFLDGELRNTLSAGQFITMFYAVLDPERRRLSYASAAHSPLLIYCAARGEVEWRHTRGAPLGAGPRGAVGKTLVDETLELAPGDLLVQYTDGYNEAFSPDDVQFDFTGVERSVLSAARGGGKVVLAELQKAVRAWTGGGAPFDDETLLIVERTPVASPLPSEVDRGEAVHAAEAGTLLAAARAAGTRLELPAAFDTLTEIRPWLSACPVLSGLNDDDLRLVESAVYEACANIVEHGYGCDAAQRIELWWVPGPERGAPERSPAAGRVHRELAVALDGGYFVIRDRGKPFRAEGVERTDLTDPAARRRGRGLGLEIMRSVASDVTTFPESDAGNLTVLRFDSRAHLKKEETSDVS